jgi:DNA primase
VLEDLMRHPLGGAGRAYLRSRGLDSVAESLRFGEITSGRYAGRLTIPHYSGRGTLVSVAMRDMTGNADAKFLYPPGFDTRLYGLDRVASAGTEIHIAEGQMDTASLVACGLPAVGVPGVNGWPRYGNRIFAGFERVYYWQQSDDKGQSEGLGERIRASLGGLGVMMVQTPPGHDVNSWLVAEGKEAVLSLIPSDEDPEPEGETGSSPQGAPGTSESEWGDDAVQQHFDDDGVVIPF